MSYIPHIAWFNRPYKPMQGYQWWPCHSTPAPGGSDRYSLSMAAWSFCIRKAILIHDPINTRTHTRAVLSQLLLLYLGANSLFIYFFSSSKVLVLISGSALCQAWWQKQWRVAGRWCIHWCWGRGVIAVCFISGCQSGSSQATCRKNGLSFVFLR